MIRRAVESDIEDVLKIEREVYDSPWSYGNFLSELNNSVSRFYVYDENGICGYIICWEIFNEDENLNEIEIVNVAVSQRYQHRGIGRKLLKYILSKSRKPFVCFLDVRVDNVPAFNLYISLGFDITGIRKDFYGKNRDAYTMKLTNCEVEYA
ncbi:MAG: ribosomal protein S18-alanine N-acetyltransferase [Calditerrivibrio sp.]|nr:ribosomal protein S18-alanine N-acetyltransferase [Calditerrivibrio sp.]MCA1932061.1 ribosomal protein S18-alanine N-acetyltransferase [Calditerrivibrio sp.]